MNDQDAAQSKWAKLNENQAGETPQQKLEIQRIYVKEQSCKVPRGSAIFTLEGKPEITLEMDVRNEPVAKNVFEVVVQVNATAKVENNTAYMMEVKQAGQFKSEGFNEEQAKQLLGAHCPDILFPYLRKIVYDATKEAGFTPCTLSPVSFASIYQQRLAQEKAKKETDAAQPMTGEVITEN